MRRFRGDGSEPELVQPGIADGSALPWLALQMSLKIRKFCIGAWFVTAFATALIALCEIAKSA